MKFDHKIHNRRSIRSQRYDYSCSGAYYVTIVTYGRECLFGEIKNGATQFSDMGRIAYENWRAIPEHSPQVELGEFVIMPNHVHGIIVTQGEHIPVAPTPIAPAHGNPIPVARAEIKPNNGLKRGSIGAINGAYKMSVTRRSQAELDGANIWQRNYFEHIIRNDDEHSRFQFYIESNPINWEEDKENPEKKQ
jgi:REP element-mobilizing transposase RayT